ncbi:MAG: GLPGLI family protein [Bacteroidaceae bacterium]|nr:GLPGLI family protein [Bacteroidaceae bacterium]
MSFLLTTFMLALTIAGQAQTKDSIDTAQFTAVYDYMVNTFNDEGTAVCDSIQIVVQTGKTVTKSMPLSQYLNQEKKALDEHDWEKSVKMGHNEALTHMPTIWINHPEGETTSRDIIFPYKCEGYEPTPQMEWTLKGDTMHINGYLCHSAETNFRGVDWEVWYTEEIPSSTGPWRLRGLPGLIVKARGDAHTFVLNDVRHESKAITYSPSVDFERMKHSKLQKYRKQVFGSKLYPKNPMHHISDNFSNNNIVSINKYITHLTVIDLGGGNQLIEANDLPLLLNGHVYQPLEK